MKCNAACIAAFGEKSTSITNIKLIIEKDNVLRMPSMKMAVHCCFAVYYIFNMSYPPALAPLMLFFEYTYQLPFLQKVPLCLSTVIDSLEKLSATADVATWSVRLSLIDS